MADEEFRQAERAFFANPDSALLRSALAHQRCRSGECCAHKLPLDELDTTTFDQQFFAVLREHSNRQLEAPGGRTILRGELRLVHQQGVVVPGETESGTIVHLNNVTACRIEDGGSGKVVILLIEREEPEWPQL